MSVIGFGAFKIGRNQGIKYDSNYDLPDDSAVEELLNGVLDLGINYIDTAPAYGLSEERIGRSIGHRKNEFILSTKVGETFQDGRSQFDFSKAGVMESIARSRDRLRMGVLDLVFVHSDGNDMGIIQHTDVVSTLQSMKAMGDIRFIGFSGKTVEGACEAMKWADAIMVEYHRDDRSHEAVIAKAATRGIGVIIKKGLASGRLDPVQGIQFVLRNPHITSMVIGGLELAHVRQNVSIAQGAWNCGE